LIAGEETRFAMLETVREFALDRLDASGEVEDATRAHALYYVALTESADLESPARAMWLARFDAEIANLAAALDWTRRAEDSALLQLRLAAATNAFWGQRGYGVEGYAWTIEALERTAGDESALRAAGYLAAGHTAWGWQEPATARAWMERSLALYETLGDDHGRVTALFHLGIIAMSLGDGQAALTSIEEANALVRAIGTRWELARGISWLGFCHFMLGDLDDAHAELTEGLALFQELNDDDQAAFNLRLLGYIARERGDVAEAWRVTVASLELNGRAGDQRGVATSASALAGVLLDRGNAGEAARLAGSAAAALERLGTYGVQPGDERDYQAIIASIRVALGDDVFETQWSHGRAQPLDDMLTNVLESPAAARAVPVPPAPTIATNLSSRELEVLRLLAVGKSNPEIADELVISRNTVYRHVNHIFTKLGTQNRTEAAIYAERHGLVDRERDS
jgi:DNA-binding CsgD family transcriptional regulator